MNKSCIQTSISFVVACLLITDLTIFQFYYNLQLEQCIMRPIPPEFVKRTCTLIDIDVDNSLNVLSVSNVCNETFHNIKVPMLFTSSLWFNCFYNVSYCDIKNSTDQDQLSDDYFQYISDYNICNTDKKTKSIRMLILMGIASLTEIAIIPVIILWCFIVFDKPTPYLQRESEPEINIENGVEMIASKFDGFETTSSNSDDYEYEKCPICTSKMKPETTVLLNCCNFTLHKQCLYEYLKHNGQPKCIGPYCQLQIKYYYRTYAIGPDPCVLCLNSLDKQSLTTGCCNKKVHQMCLHIKCGTASVRMREDKCICCL